MADVLDKICWMLPIYINYEPCAIGNINTDFKIFNLIYPYWP